MSEENTGKDKNKKQEGDGKAATPNVLSPEAAESLVRLFGLIYANAVLYGLNHKVTRRSVEEAYVKVAQALATYGEIGFHVADEVMMVNGVPVEAKNPMTLPIGAKSETASRESSGYT